jgi:hypothetical protein
VSSGKTLSRKAEKQWRVKYQKLLGIADCPEQTEVMKQNGINSMTVLLIGDSSKFLLANRTDRGENLSRRVNV